MEETCLHLRYKILGAIQNVALPEKSATPGFQEGLWKHTCFEFFLRPSSSHNYIEFNFSPSGDWALFAFDQYRSRNQQFHAPECVQSIKTKSDNTEIVCDIQLNRSGIHQAFRQSKPWEFRFSFTTVLENFSGKLSYWALQHARLKPDFHLAETFVMPVVI